MNEYFYVGLFIVSVFISSVSQILLKQSAVRSYSTKIREYANPLVIVAYSIFLASSLMTMYAYKSVPLSMGPILESMGYVFVAVLGVLVLKEKIGKKKLAGICLIVIGILVSSF